MNQVRASSVDPERKHWTAMAYNESQGRGLVHCEERNININRGCNYMQFNFHPVNKPLIGIIYLKREKERRGWKRLFQRTARMSKFAVFGHVDQPERREKHHSTKIHEFYFTKIQQGSFLPVASPAIVDDKLILWGMNFFGGFWRGEGTLQELFALDCSGDAAASDMFNSIQLHLSTESRRWLELHCPLMASDSYNNHQRASWESLPYLVSHRGSRDCFTARGDRAPLNVIVFCLPPLSFSAFNSGWIITSQCVSLPRLLFLLCQPGALPSLSLRFVNFCLVHLETNIRECTKWEKRGTGFFGKKQMCFFVTLVW